MATTGDKKSKKSDVAAAEAKEEKKAKKAAAQKKKEEDEKAARAARKQQKKEDAAAAAAAAEQKEDGDKLHKRKKGVRGGDTEEKSLKKGEEETSSDREEKKKDKKKKAAAKAASQEEDDTRGSVSPPREFTSPRRHKAKPKPEGIVSPRKSKDSTKLKAPGSPVSKARKSSETPKAPQETPLLSPGKKSKASVSPKKLKGTPSPKREVKKKKKKISFSTVVEHVLVAVAMEAEAIPFVRHLALEKDEDFFCSKLPFVAYSGKYHPEGDDDDDEDQHPMVTVVTNGKDSVYGTGIDNCGTVPAAMATYLALEKITSSLQEVSEDESDEEQEGHKVVLVNAGTCGGFKRMGAEVGDVFITTGVANHDRRIPIPSFETYGIGKLDLAGGEDESSPPPLVDLEMLASSCEFKTGICTTGNSLDKTDRDDEIMKENCASVKDMEAAAIAWSCSLHKVPMIGVKVVTDIVDGPMATQDEFLANLHKASAQLQSALPKVLDYIVQ